MALTVCAVPGCPELTEDGQCDTHRKARRRAIDRRRPDATDRGYNQRWRRTRGRYLKHHPTCEHPGCQQPATDVHHLDGQGPNGPHGHHWHNLQSLCASHHSQTTALDQPGGWNRGQKGQPS